MSIGGPTATQPHGGDTGYTAGDGRRGLKYVMQGSAVGLPLVDAQAEELSRLRGRLSDLEDELAERELELVTRHQELLHFQLRYLAIVGVRLHELDELELHIAILEAEALKSEESEAAAGRARAREQASAQALGDEEALRDAAQQPEREVSQDLKGLFRKAAKAVHPDLAEDEEDRERREVVMRAVNAAYEQGDGEALQAILQDWQDQVAPHVTKDVGFELAQVMRAIQKAEARLEAIAVELHSADDELSELYDRWQQARTDGRDLLQELAEELDREIVEASKRLLDLKTAQGSSV